MPTSRNNRRSQRGEELDRLIERFEDAWQQGNPLSITDLLERGPSVRGDLLCELVHVELELRLKAGEPVRVESYLSQFPELGDQVDNVVDFICTEHQVRRHRGEQIDVSQYLNRFPDLADVLKSRLQPCLSNDSLTVDQAPLLCPDCRSPLDLPADGLNRASCPSCGVNIQVDSVQAVSEAENLPTFGKFQLLASVGRGGFGTV